MINQNISKNKLQVVHRNVVIRPTETINDIRLTGRQTMNKIALPIKKGVALYFPYEIYYCKAQGNYTKFYFMNNDSILLSRTIKEVENSLPRNVFFRCHQSYIINKTHVRQYAANDGILLDKMTVVIPVSRRK